MSEEQKHQANKNPTEDLPARIKGLEQAKAYEGMTRADIAALDRSIAKLKEKLAAKNPPKEQEQNNSPF